MGSLAFEGRLFGSVEVSESFLERAHFKGHFISGGEISSTAKGSKLGLGRFFGSVKASAPFYFACQFLGPFRK